MRTKSLLALLVVTVAAVVVAFLLGNGPGSPISNPQAGKLVLPEVGKRLADVGRVALVHGESKITLVLQGDKWTMEERGSYPADSTKVQQALLGLAELRYVEPKTRKADAYPRLEVEDADKAGAKSTLITVADKKGSLLGEVIAGKHRADQLGGGTDGVYIREPGDAQSWLARGTLDLSGELPKWLDQKLVDLPLAQIKMVELTGADGAKVTIQRDKPEDKLALVDMPKDKKLKSDSALDDPAGALAGLSLDDVRPAKEFEFPKDGAAQARYVTFDGLTLTIAVAQKDGKDWARFSASGTGKAEKQATDLQASLSPWIYQLSSFKAKQLETKLADLLEQPKGS